MRFYEKVLAHLEEKKCIKEKGNFNGIPMPFERYSEYVPTIDKGVYYGLMAGPGEGKSRFSRFAFVYQPIKFSLKTGYPIKILYFALEDNRMQIYKHIIIHYLWERHNISISLKELESKDKPLSNFYLNKIREDHDFYTFLEENLFILEDLTTPDAIFETCKKAYEKYGDDVHYIVIIDNYANIINNGKYNSEWEAIGKLSREYIRLHLCRKLNMSVIGIVQSDLDSVKYTARNAGKGGLSSIEPNLGSFGNNKQITRDFHVIWALFTPWRYEMSYYMQTSNQEGYNIEILRNRFKSLIMLKNNLGEMAPRLGLFFDGLHEVFTEMPRTDDKEQLNLLYERLRQQQMERLKLL